MVTRSHVDPLLFIVFMHVGRRDLDDDAARTVASANLKEGESFAPVLHRLKFRQHQTIAHETYHFWQGLRLPFVFRYATLAFRQAFLAFKQLSKQSADFQTWDCLLPELHRLTLDFCVAHEGSNIYWGGPDATFPTSTKMRLAPMDLLECATSLAEFQVTSTKTQRTDPVSFGRWSKRNGAYDAPYKFAVEFLGDEALILRCLLPLINASFHTTEPTRAFVELLGRLWGLFGSPSAQSRGFLAQPEPCRWSEMFEDWLSQLNYDNPPDSDGKLLGGGYFRLNLEKWVGGQMGNVDGHMIHPFLGIPAREWIEMSKHDPILTTALDYPGWMGDSFGKLRKHFTPPLTVFRFHLGDLGDRVFLQGEEPAKAFSTVPLSGREWHGFVADVMAMYSAVRRASGAHFDAEQRTCHHKGCPHYELNFCNSYPIVPLDHATCGFPNRMQKLMEIWSSK